MTGESPGTAQWQVTCPCGWRTHGTKEVVIAAVQEHGRTTHGQELSEQQVLDLAVQIGPGAPGGA